MKKLTIILPVYNAASTLRRTLSSCVAQDYPDIELIVLDAGSTDGSTEIIAEFSPYIAHWKSEHDCGIYDAWNKGLRRASGNWICFFGADDCWRTVDSVSRLMAVAAYPAVNLVLARLCREATSGAPKKIYGERWCQATMRRRMLIAHVGMPHHISLFEQFGEFDSTYRIAGDYHFLLRASAAVRAAFFDEVIADVGAGGVSSTQFRQVRDESIRALRSTAPAGWLDAMLFKAHFNVRHLSSLWRQQR